MTIEAGITIVLVSRNTLMLIVHIRLVMLMAIDTAKQGIVGRVGMTFGTAIPFVTVFAAIDGEILPVVIEGGRFPHALCMTRFAICWKLR